MHAHSNEDGRGSRPIRLVLADDSYLVREAISHVLGARRTSRWSRSARDATASWTAIEAERPDVVLTDIRMPPGDDAEGMQDRGAPPRDPPRHRRRRAQPVPEPRYALELSGRARTAAPTSSRSASTTATARRRDPRDAPPAVGDRPEGGRAARASALPAEDADRRAHPREREILAAIARARATPRSPSRCRSRSAPSRSTSTRSSEAALAEAEDVSRRVKAALIFLSTDGSARQATPRPLRGDRRRPGTVGRPGAAERCPSRRGTAARP